MTNFCLIVSSQNNTKQTNKWKPNIKDINSKNTKKKRSLSREPITIWGDSLFTQEYISRKIHEVSIEILFSWNKCWKQDSQETTEKTKTNVTLCVCVCARARVWHLYPPGSKVFSFLEDKEIVSEVKQFAWSHTTVAEPGYGFWSLSHNSFRISSHSCSRCALHRCAMTYVGTTCNNINLQLWWQFYGKWQ